jgi:surface polysaccharide O-acyltransferase-like enzyme
MSTKKIYYLDNLKVLLTVLVVLHHTFITYGASGGWYYKQPTDKIGALIPMTMFVAINQSFFMGFFFFLSAYFIRPSYERKGRARFVTDRLVRLGIPLVFYSFVLSPFMIYLIYYFAKGHYIGYLSFLGGFDDWIDFGVLWFAAALLLFTLVFILWKKGAPVQKRLPSMGDILLFAVGIGVISFLVRIIFPVGWVLKPLGFQFGHFTQYISLFVLGIVASKNDWLNRLEYRTGKGFLVAVVLLVLFFPVFYVIKLKLDMPLEWYSGGFHWQSLLYAIWEQVIGFSIIVLLLAWGKEKWNRSSAFLSGLSRATFAVYIFHPLVVISLSLAVRNWSIDPAMKLLFVAPLAVPGSFLLGSLLVRIPGVRKII